MINEVVLILCTIGWMVLTVMRFFDKPQERTEFMVEVDTDE